MGTDRLPATAAARQSAVQGARPDQRTTPKAYGLFLHGAPYILVFATYLALALRLFRMISQRAVNILFYDQWDFDNATLFEKHSLWEIFRWQHGPHRQGLGGVLSKLLEPSVRWNTRYEDFAIGAVILVSAVLALYLKYRLFGAIRYSDVIIPGFFLTPAQYQTLLAATNPSHGSLPLLLIILYCLTWTLGSYPWKYLCVLVTNFLLIYTGFGIFVGFLTPPLIAVDYYCHARHQTVKYQASSAAALLVSIASMASFFVGYKLEPAADCFSIVPANPIRYAAFMSLMFANVVKGNSLPPLLTLLMGGLLLVAVVICLGTALARLFRTETNSWTRSAVISLLLGYCLLFCFNTAYGRQCLGLALAWNSRYVTYVIVGFFGLYLFSLSMPAKRELLIIALCALALLSSGRMDERDWMGTMWFSNGKRAWRQCYLTRHDIGQCNALTGFQIYPGDDHGQLQRKLDFLEQNHLNLFADPDSDH
jgi:hypothetical protein